MWMKKGLTGIDAKDEKFFDGVGKIGFGNQVEINSEFKFLSKGEFLTENQFQILHKMGVKYFVKSTTEKKTEANNGAV